MQLGNCPIVKRVSNGTQPSSNGCGGSGINWAIPDNPNFDYVFVITIPIPIPIYWGPSFLVACHRHDMNYSTCNVKKAVADDQFRVDLELACNTFSFVSDNIGGVYHSADERFQECHWNAVLYYTAVQTAGGLAYDIAQRDVCDCCGLLCIP